MIVNHCGINRSHRDFRIHRPGGSGDYLFLYTKAPACFTLDGTDIFTPEHTVFLYRKGSAQFFRGTEPVYCNDYIHFNTESPADEQFIRQLRLHFDTPLQLPDVESFMHVQQQIVHETVNRSEWAAEAIDSLLRYFLIKLTESMSLRGRNYEKALLSRIHFLRSRIYKEPQLPWSVPMMAESVNLSISYFQTLYKHMFQISCIQDVICARIALAENLLLFTDNTAREIAAACGYQNEIHFSRQFRKMTGKTPMEYRGK